MDCGSFPLYFRYYDSRLNVVRKILLEKRCVCDIGNVGEEYGSIMYSYDCIGKWLMDSHESLLMFFLFYLQFERNIKIIVRTRNIYGFIVFI